MNCLIYALRFWKENPDYKIWYNSDHCINIPTFVKDPFPNKEFLPAEEFGYNYFKSWHHALITDHEQNLLKEYFNIT